MFVENGDPSDEKTSSTEESSTEKETDKGGDDSKETLFFNPNEVPPELKGAFKKMQASFTQKMQKAGLVIRKAEAFEELVNNPEFQAWAEEQRTGKPSSKPSKKSNKADDEDDGEETPSGKLDLEGLEKIVDKVVAKRVAPLVRVQHREQADREWKALTEQYPEAENYKDAIAEEIEANPGMSYMKAFKQVAFDDVVKSRRKQNNSEKKAANTEKPSSMAPGDKTPPRAKTIQEAAKLAVAQLKEKK